MMRHGLLYKTLQSTGAGHPEQCAVVSGSLLPLCAALPAAVCQCGGCCLCLVQGQTEEGAMMMHDTVS